MEQNRDSRNKCTLSTDQPDHHSSCLVRGKSRVYINNSKNFKMVLLFFCSLYKLPLFRAHIFKILGPFYSFPSFKLLFKM
jgi:hypothetical protein